MSKLVIALVFVAVILIGGLMQLLRNSSQPMGTPEQLERAKQRNRELEEKAADEFEALARDWRREYRFQAGARGHFQRPLSVSARRPSCARGRRFRRARRSQRSRRSQSDSGGSDGDGPGGDPPGSLVEAYGVAPLRARAAEGSNLDRTLRRASPPQRKRGRACGRGPYPEVARAALRLRSAASEAHHWGAGPRSGRRGEA